MPAPKKKQSKKKKTQSNISTIIKFELLGIILCTLATISFANLGLISVTIRLFTSIFMGSWGFIILLMAFFLGIYVIIKRGFPDFKAQRIIGLYLIIASILIFAHLSAVNSKKIPLYENNVFVQTWKHIWNNFFSSNYELEIGGGMLGAGLFFILSYLFGLIGSKIIAISLFLSGFILLTNLSINKLFSKLLYPLKQGLNAVQKSFNKTAPKITEAPNKFPAEAANSDEAYKLAKTPFPTEMANTNSEDTEINISNFSDNIKAQQEELNEVNNRLNNDHYTQKEDDSDYSLPPLSLLKSIKKINKQKALLNINKNAQKLEDTLYSFGVKAKVSQIHLGPAVTQYEVTPEIGVKVSKIVALADDIALALAAKDIRIEAPIPGKSAVGIEVPNSDISIVTLKEVLEQIETESHKNLLTVALGRDITGAPIFAELNKMPHLLVAGSTGSGKSVCINGIIISLIMRTKPHELKMVMIDPKMVELNIYNGIPHLLAPVVTDPKRAAKALYKIVTEMEQRYELFSNSNTRNIEGYNESIKTYNEISDDKNKKTLLPYIVVIIDELADLMMVASSDVEDAIIRISQMARAAGIHLIIATQRPSVDVITGIIKANIPSRIAFAVSSNIDSRTIIDTSGAEKLLGRGDMLFYPMGIAKPIRVQGAFLSDAEVENIVNHVTAQQPANYNLDMIVNDDTSLTTNNTHKKDQLFDEAVALVIEMKTASVSLLQRRFRIGYSRAARLIDEMEKQGIVGPYEGSKPRKVLKTSPPEK